MIFTQYPNDFLHKRKIYYFDPYDVLYTCATGFVVQGHIFCMTIYYILILPNT